MSPGDPVPEAAADALDALRRGERPASLTAGVELTLEQVRVGDAMTAARVGSGDLPVLASPVLVRFVEQVAVRILHGHLPAELTTVGVSISLSHEAPTSEGGAFTLIVRLEPGEGRTLHFTFVASDGVGEVGRGTHDRVIVDRARFMDVAERRRVTAKAIGRRQRRGK